MGQFSSSNAKCRIKLFFQCISYSAVTEYCFTSKAPLKILEIDGEEQEKKEQPRLGLQGVAFTKSHFI